MTNRFANILDTIGRTPVVKINKLAPAGVNLYVIAMRHAWSRDYGDLIQPKKRCMWIEERALFEIFTTRSNYPIPIRVILRESTKVKRIAAAYFSLKDPVPFLKMFASWIRNGLRRIRHLWRQT